MNAFIRHCAYLHADNSQANAFKAVNHELFLSWSLHPKTIFFIHSCALWKAVQDGGRSPPTNSRKKGLVSFRDSDSFRDSPDPNRYIPLQKREPTKQIWLLTYGSACKSVDNAMLAHCGLTIDECYTAKWRESKYTLIRLRKEHRIRQSGFANIMKQLQIEFGILGTGIFGFDIIAYNSKERDESLQSHPGFKLIVDTLNHDPDKLEWWMLNGDIQSNRKGLLWKHIESTEPSNMTRAQLIQLVQQWSPSMKGYDQLKQHNEFLTERLQETENAYRQACASYEMERKQNDQLMQQLITKTRECGDLQKELIRMRPISKE